MDRFSAAGVLPKLQDAFHMTDSGPGLLHGVFATSYMLCSLAFGYIGDRWNRKYIMCAGISFWSIMILCSSFIPNDYFLPLLLIKGLIGAGEASFSTIAPSIIADLFVADQRSRMLAIFYFVVPVGCGLGYIIGSKVTSAAGGDWHWAFRVTPGLGLLGVLLMVFFLKEPPRGATDKKKKIKLPCSNSWMSDVKKLFRNPSFMFSTLGVTAVTFVVSAIGLWVPSFLERARNVLHEKEPCQTAVCTYDDSLIFGAITVLSGILGVVAGVEISKRYKKVNPRADPIVCACGMLISAPFLFLALVFGNISLVATYIFIFIAGTLLAFNWAIVTIILLYVVPSTRRATAQSMQITVSNLLGVAGSPFLIGLISDLIRRGYAESDLLKYRSLEYALMTCSFVVAIGGAFFLATAHFIEKDHEKAETESED
ncbi:protein spinster homolog 1-like [Bufo bufo]|uniref:protein spinster homolog 1-like n=1 Tax=Bufo bufo TaxID=8384 RepID=UPI001ABEDFE0|nr:protein spinster homolog 1-like [Bufo bufo]